MTGSGPEPWDGRGLPPVAAQRIARARDSAVAGSLLSVQDAAALTATGFAPVGGVMGCVVQHTGWSGWGGCGCYPGSGPAQVVLAGSSRYAGQGPYVRTLYAAWDSAMARMLAEASALGADGVVGIAVTEKFLDAAARELLMQGTAVRGNGRTRAQHPFATDLSGADTSKLLHAGWVPSGIVFGTSVGTRHDDGVTLSRASYFSGNGELGAYTKLLTAVRADARRQLAARAKAHGGEAVIVSDMSLRIWETECQGYPRGQDHSAEARIRGTVATRFSRETRPTDTSLTILPLRDPKEPR